MSIHGTRVFIDWVIGMLTAGGLTVGDGVAPSTVPAGSGYVVVYSVAGGFTSGTIDAPRSDAEATVQVTSVGVDPRQTRWLVDKVRSLFDVSTPATMTDGRTVMWVDFPMGSPTVVRDDDVSPPNWYSPDRLEMGTTP